jgi:acetate kinase
VAVLVVNPGSSSLKLHVLDDADAVLAGHDVPLAGGCLDGGDIAGFLADHPDVRAVGVRVVHGGAEFRQAVLVDQTVEDRLAEVADLAPLHGLSHAYASRRAAAILGRPAAGLRLVICHLGAGASLAAVAGGSPLDTTMRFTPLDGLVMATRPGSVDPGLLMWVQEQGGLPVDEVGRSLLFEAGLAGLSGTSGDMRDVIAAADRGDERATLALSVYLHRLRGSIASMVAALGGLDAVVFTGGVGQNSARIRADACAGLSFLGLIPDPGRNRADHAGDRDVAGAKSPVRILVVQAREEEEIAREVRRIIG